MLVEDTCALISIASENPPGEEQAAAEWTRQRLATFMATDVQMVSKGRSNCIATLDFGPGPGFVLCTHLDVVPVEHPAQRVPSVENGRITGRGSADAKGALAAMIAACEALAANPTGLRGRLILAAVADEETSALGALRFVRDGIEADAAVIGEPTSNLPVLASRGAVRLAITFRGRSAHSSEPSKGSNAIYRAARFILAVETLNATLQRTLGAGRCAATVVNGGTKLNVIPNACTVLVDRRLTPGESSHQALDEIHGLIATLRRRDPDLEWAWSEAGVWLDSFAIPETSPFAQQVLETTGRPPGPVFLAGTDAPHLIGAGIPTVILGPGGLAQAHSPDEWVAISDLLEAAHLYERLARHFLRDTSPVSITPTRPVMEKR